MQSSNPVFTRSEGFNGKGGYVGFGETPVQQGGYTSAPTHTEYGTGTGRMTIDSVVQKTGMTLGIVVLVAAATWILTGDVISVDPVTRAAELNDRASLMYTLSLVGLIGGFVLGLVNSFKRVVSPPLIIAYAVLEGLFLGAASKTFQLAFGGGVVTGALLGTVAAVGGTLAAYKFFDIKVTEKFRTFVIAAGFGFMALTMLDVVLSIFDAQIGFNGFGGLGLVMSFVGLGLAILFLVMDFDFVEKGIAAGLPERESWRAAFGLTVTIIWIYIELLRILAILRGD